MDTTPRFPELGDVIAGKYVLRERLGEGGMGVVFRADQPALARSVAIKVLHPRLVESEWIARRFCAEAMAASRVQHAGAVSVIEHDVTCALPFIVMDHVRGRPLAQLVAEERIPTPRALEIVDQILGVLDAAHAAGVVHGDVKSANVLVEQRAGRDVVTVIDFGLARVDGAWREDEPVSGTPEYMAPEVVRGEPPTRASDLYGVAVILYELLTGATPFASDSSAEIFTRHLEDLAAPPSERRRARDLPAGLDEIVLRGLAKDPRARFADARELQLALRALAAGEPAACRRCPRRAIARAMVAGDVAAIARGYVALAEALARDHRPAEARRELEEGLDVLTDHPREGQRLVAALAALARRAAEERAGLRALPVAA